MGSTAPVTYLAERQEPGSKAKREDGCFEAITNHHRVDLFARAAMDRLCCSSSRRSRLMVLTSEIMAMLASIRRKPRSL